MRKTFVEKLKKEEAFAIIKNLFGNRFEPFNVKPLKSKKAVNFIDKQHPDECWGFFVSETVNKYLNIPVKDTVTGFETSVCLLDSKVVVLGYENINNNQHVQKNYHKNMFNRFHDSYRMYLYQQVDKELDTFNC